MGVKNLFDTTTKREIIERVNKLTPESPALWGKMNVAQMLRHCQMPMGVALGNHKIKGSFVLRLIGPLFKKILYNDKPFKHNLSTDPSFKIVDEKEFYTEKGKLLDMINRYTEANMIDEPHPIFGRLTKEQWSKGTWKHLDHHLQQFGV